MLTQRINSQGAGNEQRQRVESVESGEKQGADVGGSAPPMRQASKEQSQ